VLYLYGNYGGDVYNFDLAAEMASAEGIATRTVLGADDVLSAPADQASTRRGIAGLVMVYKIAGAAAGRGDTLDEGRGGRPARGRRGADRWNRSRADDSPACRKTHPGLTT
jgi:dihydroxyacetone kinase